MPIVTQFEVDEGSIPLQVLADALAARSTLAKSMPPNSDSEAFAQLETRVNAQLEASAAYLAMTS